MRMLEGISLWKRMVTIARGISTILVKELFRLDDLYNRLERAVNERHELDLKHDLVYVVNNGLLTPDDQNITLERKRDELCFWIKRKTPPIHDQKLNPDVTVLYLLTNMLISCQ